MSDKPKRPPSSRPHTPSRRSDETGSKERKNARPSVLIVDDDPIHRKAASLLVRSLGFDPEAVVDGHEALQALQDRHFDVVLMDLHMPVMDGITATREIHRRWPPSQRPTIIAITATDIPGERESYLEAGAVACLSKPINRKELARLLDPFLRAQY